MTLKEAAAILAMTPEGANEMTTETFTKGQRVNHYTTRMPNGTGTVVSVEGPRVTVKWDRSGITREVHASNLKSVA